MVERRFNMTLFNKNGKILAIGGIMLIVFVGLYLALPALLSVSASEDLVASPDVAPDAASIGVTPDAASIGGGGAIASASPSPSPSPILIYETGAMDADNGVDPETPSFVTLWYVTHVPKPEEMGCGYPAYEFDYKDTCRDSRILAEAVALDGSRICGYLECCLHADLRDVDCVDYCHSKDDTWGECKTTIGYNRGYCLCGN